VSDPGTLVEQVVVVLDLFQQTSGSGTANTGGGGGGGGNAGPVIMVVWRFRNSYYKI
jgi:hypothetical protein